MLSMRARTFMVMIGDEEWLSGYALVVGAFPLRRRAYRAFAPEAVLSY